MGVLAFFPLVSFAACDAGGQQLTLLHSASGHDSARVAGVVDSFVLPALDSTDILLVFGVVRAVGNSSSVYDLYSVTDSVSLTNSSAFIPLDDVSASTAATGTKYLMAVPDSSTSTFSTDGAVSTGGNKLVAHSIPSGWTSGWTLGLRSDGSQLSGGNADWRWTVYKLNVSGVCSSGAAASASSTDVTGIVTAQETTNLYLQIALELAVFAGAFTVARRLW